MNFYLYFYGRNAESTMENMRRYHRVRILLRMMLYGWILSVGCFVSCRRTPVEEALHELDAAIGQRGAYVAAFERQNDSLRAAFSSASSDSVRWALSSLLYQAYHHFSVDSAGRYVMRMQRYAASEEEVFRTSLSEIQLLVWAHDEERALSLYQSMDTSRMSALGLRDEYLASGIEIFTNISRFPRFLREDRDYTDSLRAYRKAYIAEDTLSYYGKKVLAQSLRDEGRLEEALSLFQACFREAHDYHELTSIAYNSAMLCGMLGRTDDKKIYLANSAIYDFKAPNRDLLSLYELAMTLYGEGDLSRASRYIKIHFDDVLAGDFEAKVIRSSKAQNIIVDASLKAERSKRIIFMVGLIMVVLLLFVIFVMLNYVHRKAIQLAEANAALEDSNKALAESNSALAEANKIKDNYVFRYMDLSIRYLDKVEENRHEYRQIAKNKGTDALLKELRSPAEFADYKEFYSIFDQTFLGIFPHFVEDVNALLREEVRFNVSESKKSLPTELRILATLKLGIHDSPQIASFLKCSLSTVYTYRAKLRNQALCPKDEFEARVKNL